MSCDGQLLKSRNILPGKNKIWEDIVFYIFEVRDVENKESIP